MHIRNNVCIYRHLNDKICNTVLIIYFIVYFSLVVSFIFYTYKYI